MSQISLRPASEADLPQLLTLEARAFERPWPEGSFRQELALPRAELWVAVDGERFAGYVDFWVVPPDIELLNIAVDPDYRRRGLGRMLLDVVERRGRERGGEQVFLEVRRSNLGAQRLYEAAGFSQCGIRKGYYSDNGEDAILLTRNLP